MLTTALAALLLFIPQSPEVGAKVYAAVADSVLAASLPPAGSTVFAPGNFLSTTGASSQSPSTAAKMAQRALESLEQTKLRYEKQKDGVWVVTFEGEHVDSIRVFIIASDDMLVVSSLINATPSLLSAETLRALLVANYDANYSKAAMSKDGDVMAIADVADYIDTFYNRSRRHSHLGGVSPEQFEAVHKPRRQSVH